MSILDSYMQKFVASPYNAEFIANARKEKTVKEADLLAAINRYNQHAFSNFQKDSPAYQKAIEEVYHGEQVGKMLKKQAVKAFEKAAGANVVARNGRSVVGNAFLTLFGSFAAALIVIGGLQLGGIAVLPTFVALVPALALLGPIGGFFMLAAVIAVAALALYGLGTGAAAAATSKKVSVAPANSEEDLYVEQTASQGASANKREPFAAPRSSTGRFFRPQQSESSNAASSVPNESNDTAPSASM
ncbi:MAG: hypothetical protein A3F17_04760 [Gammaproteobacteria bacterium RIFCSPHIGHO2_12_FULL_41_15]|nr:MAG: hypothetical protein A3F17_04760 [Gammaproteobacteria bacterium RIFCSPHIGHO2_12_FULL_41_15]